jgi:hypothetical protein
MAQIPVPHNNNQGTERRGNVITARKLEHYASGTRQGKLTESSVGTWYKLWGGGDHQGPSHCYLRRWASQRALIWL